MARVLASVLALLFLAACAPTAPPPPVGAVTATGNAAIGQVYAEQNCAQCHAVAPGATLSPRVDAPPFEALANLPGMTPVALSAWLQSSHENMPMVIVEPARIDDLAAYLATLRPAR